MSLIRATLAALLLGAASAEARDVGLDVVPVALDESDPGETRIDALEYLGGFVLDADDPDWGGYSGMLITPAGDRLLAVSDVGDWLELRLRHDSRGRLRGVDGARLWPLLGPDGRPLGGKADSDAEALAGDPSGGLLVAFEVAHRVWRYPPGTALDTAVPKPVKVPQAVGRLPGNSGIEGMVALGPGKLLLLSETGGETADIPAWLLANGKWSALKVARTGSYAATDVARLPDGDLLLLERRFSLLGGPAARLSVIPAAAVKAGAVLRGRQIAELRLPRTVDNFEAVAGRSGPDGSTLIYLMSDDNQNLLQRTLLLQFRLQ